MYSIETERCYSFFPFYFYERTLLFFLLKDVFVKLLKEDLEVLVLFSVLNGIEKLLHGCGKIFSLFQVTVCILLNPGNKM